jgi:hypothetical protein
VVRWLRDVPTPIVRIAMDATEDVNQLSAEQRARVLIDRQLRAAG